MHILKEFTFFSRSLQCSKELSTFSYAKYLVSLGLQRACPKNCWVQVSVAQEGVIIHEIVIYVREQHASG